MLTAEQLAPEVKSYLQKCHEVAPGAKAAFNFAGLFATVDKYLPEAIALVGPIISSTVPAGPEIVALLSAVVTYLGHAKGPVAPQPGD